jgi:signal transduction histidine kinase/ActR/RegA family two-component response regulator
MKIDAEKLKRLLNDATKKIKPAESNIEINNIIEKLITSAINSEHASLWAFDETQALLVRERDVSQVRELSMLDQRGVLSKCFLTLSSGIYNYLASEKEYYAKIDNPDNIRMKSKIILPILDDDRLIGMLTAYSSIKKIKNFDENDIEVLEAMLPFLSTVIYRMHPQIKDEEIERVYISEHLVKTSHDFEEKVEELEHNQESTNTSDEVLSFLSNTVHDIRTPANTLYGFLELLEDQLDNPRLLQYINNAKESAQFINELTTSILDRVSTQRERTKAEPVSISSAKFFADIAESFSANMFNKKINFNVYIDPLIAKEIIIEEMLLKRVIINLIGNAYKFTPSGKTINFSVQYEAAKRRLQVSIKDTGIGIAKEKQKEIFKAFTQAQDNTSLHYGGTGLGLAISSQYVNDLGGELKLKSELDVGSTFYFEIPLKVSNAAATFRPVRNKKLRLGILLSSENIFSSLNLTRYLQQMNLNNEMIYPTQSISEITEETTHLICFQSQLNDDVITLTHNKKIELLVVEEDFLSLIDKEESSDYSVISQYGYYANTLHTFISNNVQLRVLVVDDDRINIQLIKAILEEEFCQVETAMDGEVALEMLKEAVKEDHPYTMVYLDKHMPKLSGTEVIDTFRTFEKSVGAAPVFSISISGDAVSEAQKNKNFDTYVGKPFNKKAIKETLKQVRSKR